MFSRHTFCLVLCLFIHAGTVTRVTSSAHAASPPATPWLTDPTDAILNAAKEHRDALIWFSREEDSAVGTSESQSTAYARCRLMYPQRSFERPDEAQWFIAWADRFAVQAIPSVVMIDPEGRPYAQIAGTPNDASLTAAQQARADRDAAVIAANASSGLDRARHLDAALRAVGPYAMREYRVWADEVVALDANNDAGLRAIYAPRLAEKTMDEVIQGDVYLLIDAGAYDQARARLAQLQTTLPGLSAEQRQTLTAFRAQLLITEGKPEEARRLLRQALDLAPQSEAAQTIRGSLGDMP